MLESGEKWWKVVESGGTCLVYKLHPVYVDLETQGFPFTLLPRTQYNGLVEFYYILLVIPPPPPQSSTCASKTFSSVSLIHTLLTNQPSKYFTK